MTGRAIAMLLLLATVTGACAPTWTPGTPIPPGYEVKQDALSGEYRMYSPFRQCMRGARGGGLLAILLLPGAAAVCGAATGD